MDVIISQSWDDAAHVLLLEQSLLSVLSNLVHLLEEKCQTERRAYFLFANVDRRRMRCMCDWSASSVSRQAKSRWASATGSWFSVSAGTKWPEATLSAQIVIFMWQMFWFYATPQAVFQQGSELWLILHRWLSSNQHCFLDLLINFSFSELQGNCKCCHLIQQILKIITLMWQR